MGLKNEKVYLESNYKQWKKMFEDEKEELNKIFDKEDVLIEHVGSTAIEGLLAKPIIDIVIGIDDIKEIEKYISKLNNIYTIKINKENNEVLLIKENNIETFYLIHVLNRNSNRLIDMIRFRNILRKDNNILKQYEQLKRSLSIRYSNNRRMYTKSKNDFIKNVLKDNKY